jgi:hypothetical protein
MPSLTPTGLVCRARHGDCAVAVHPGLGTTRRTVGTSPP